MRHEQGVQLGHVEALATEDLSKLRVGHDHPAVYRVVEIIARDVEGSAMVVR